MQEFKTLYNGVQCLKLCTMVFNDEKKLCTMVFNDEKSARQCATQCSNVTSRVGPQSQNWSDQQNTLDPTGSIHKKARGKKFDPKKVDFDEGDCI